MRIIRIVLLATSVLLVSVSAAKADTVISASGTWGTAACTPPSCIAPEYAPGESWSFSFHVSDPATDVVDISGGTGGQFQTHQVSDFVYLLNGAPVAVSLPDADFFDTTNLGLFDLDLSDANTFTLTGPQVFAGSPPPIMTFTPGVFTADLVQIPNRQRHSDDYFRHDFRARTRDSIVAGRGFVWLVVHPHLQGLNLVEARARGLAHADTPSCRRYQCPASLFRNDKIGRHDLAATGSKYRPRCKALLANPASSQRSTRRPSG